MNLEIPKRHIFDITTGKERVENYHWVEMEGKSPKEILYEIKDELKKNYSGYQNVDDMLEQAIKIILSNFINPEKNSLYFDLTEQRKKLSNYDKQISEDKKNKLIAAVIDESSSSIEYYYEK